MLAPRLIPTLWLATAVSPGLGACLDAQSSEDPEHVMCVEQSDCETAAGEICDEGICWGDPPDRARFAAVLVPPVDRADLAATEVPLFDIALDGTMGGLHFADSIVVSGRVTVACPDDVTEGCGPDHAVAAQIVVERASIIDGGPRYKRQVVSRTDVDPEEDSFSFRLPQDGAEYRVTVKQSEAPLAQADDGTPPLQVPPMSRTLVADADQRVTWELGDPSKMKLIRGCIENALGNGSRYQGMHVTALGRWSPLARLERASAVARADAEGCFELAVPINMLDEFDVVAKPAAGDALPTLRLAGEYVRDPLPEGPPVIHEIEPALVMPNTANPTTFRLPIRGRGSGGSQVPVAGAELTFTTAFDVPTSETRDVTVTFTAQAISNGPDSTEPGVAVVELYPGSDVNRIYDLRIVPPADSEFASAFALEVAVGTGEGATVLEAVELDRRVAISGRVTTAAGEPLSGAPLRVEASPLLRAKLDGGDAAIFDNLQFPTDTTGDDGQFFLWLDRMLVGESAVYDLSVAPPAFADAPHWTFQATPIPGQGDAVDLGDLALPPASHARGPILAPDGQAVPGAELRLYQLPDPAFCQGVEAGDDCDPEAALRGIWEADVDGQVQVVLPDP